MPVYLKYVVILGFFVSVLSKTIHFKEDLETKDRDAKTFMNLFKNEELFTENERFARHMEVFTESVLEHIMSESKNQYFNKNYNANSPIRRLIRNLNKEMKRNKQDKIVKHREKKKTVSKKQKLTRKKKRTRGEPSQKQYHKLII